MRLSIEHQSRSGTARAHWLRGWAYSELGRLAEAEAELEAAGRMQRDLKEGNRLEVILVLLERVRAARA
jgi:hypothetical protein